MAAGDTLRRITQQDQVILDATGAVVGLKNPNASGGDLRVDASTLAGTLSRPLNMAATPWRGKPVANESMWLDGTNFTTVYGLNSRKRYIANRATGYVRLVYAAASNANDLSPSDPITVRCALEPTNGGTRVRGYFNGQVDGLVSPGGILVSDPIPAAIALGQQFYIWTYASCANQPVQGSSNFNTTVASWLEGCDAAVNTAPSDKSMDLTVTANGVGHYSPIAVIGDAGAGLPFVGFFGDSIGTGFGDLQVIADVGRGFYRRAMNNAIPFVNLCLSGDSYTNSHQVRYALFNGCTDVVDEMGINDVIGGATAATIEANMVSAWQELGKFGARVWRTTLTPRTTSTDSWATLANQTVTAVEPVRVAVNTWIRDGAPLASVASLVPVAAGTVGALRAGSTGHPLSGYFETADTVESARNSGKWNVGSVYLTDTAGLHPNSVGHAAMAAAIDTTRFSA